MNVPAENSKQKTGPSPSLTEKTPVATPQGRTTRFTTSKVHMSGQLGFLVCSFTLGLLLHFVCSISQGCETSAGRSAISWSVVWGLLLKFFLVCSSRFEVCSIRVYSAPELGRSFRLGFIQMLHSISASFHSIESIFGIKFGFFVSFTDFIKLQIYLTYEMNVHKHREHP